MDGLLQLAQLGPITVLSMVILVFVMVFAWGVWKIAPWAPELVRVLRELSQSVHDDVARHTIDEQIAATRHNEVIDHFKELALKVDKSKQLSTDRG